MKFIIYIIIIFLVIRIIRSLMNTRVIIRKFDSRQGTQNASYETKKEGKITIVEMPDKNQTGHTASKGEPGDYVDYEEIK